MAEQVFRYPTGGQGKALHAMRKTTNIENVYKNIRLPPNIRLSATTHAAATPVARWELAAELLPEPDELPSPESLEPVLLLLPLEPEVGVR